MSKIKTITIQACLCLLLTLAILSGCSNQSQVKLNPKKPVTITVWHYYNGSILNAFDTMVQEFNESVGMENGIIVEGHSFSSVRELETAVLAAANEEVGSMELPNIFASYADTAYAAETIGVLADIDEHFTADEQAQYLDSYIEEGKIGLHGELRIFPIAKSTEILMINETDWQPFAQAHNLSHDDLATMEGIAKTAKLYYEWTDAQTPDIANDGKAFFGRDSMPNMFIIASAEFGVEIFEVNEGKCTLQIDHEVMKHIWDLYYIPYIKGYYTAQGKYRSDDVRIGELLAYVGSTSSATYFPGEVTINSVSHPVETVVLPPPRFETADNLMMVQQGAGMAVTRATPQEEYASVEFLKWFTDAGNNIEFAAMSGYMPVKKDASSYDSVIARLAETDIEINDVTDQTLRVTFAEMTKRTLYTNKAFRGGAQARNVLDHHLQTKADADRLAVIEQMAAGLTLEEAAAPYASEKAFNSWLSDFTQILEDVIMAE